ncbi:Eco29kI family restriction endonuclease, partial [Methanocrinis sp.]|uniref:Eco29kI family restriction endonuclease n=1 Tax=Methanocrinis sp. TaxID=3101522 RepID=UPI003D0DE9F6
MPLIDTYTFRSPQLKDVLGGAVDFFLSRPFSSLPPDFKFNGPGVYGLYYFGDFELYEKISQLNNHGDYLPIYIGKAVPPGWRTARIMSTE